MFPKPESSIVANTAAYETTPLVRPTGFREYDARWLFGSELNLMGAQALGLGLGTLLHDLQVPPDIVIAHDYRSYSASIKMAMATGLMAAGCRVHDIGLAVSPMAYFAQFELDLPAVAMVTASHNDNGWTGVKMGADRPVTFGPDEMGRLKEIVLSGAGIGRVGGQYRYVAGFAARYAADLVAGKALRHPLKAVVACGNGTAGMIAPGVLRAIGCEVIELDCELDHTFPNYNPNPEDMAMLHAVADAVRRHGADVGLAFDGDGDRCGVIDDSGEEIFADKVGLLLARDLAALHPGSHFVVDVKSTGLFATDPELKRHGATVDYWKTGHSYIKRRVREAGARAGFEKSGHFFFNAPIGRGYDDGLIAAIAVCEMLDRNPGQALSGLRAALPVSWQSPTMSPHCADEDKYDVVDRVTAHFAARADARQKVANQAVREINTINGIRIVLEDGTWGLVRASSNKPELVVVVESPSSEGNMRAIFKEIDAFLAGQPEVGAYNQKI
ncbi:phosphomannomutase/phosphoglucomutase [Microbaculum marinum]|uniref:Phosphomannomutase/phosphoglucomutase n=1 Tax=Microbaculum marinum TaxID=1764581 RepID=A0AAW9RT32_9HYPH